MADESREFALLCPSCGEENPPEFPACWSCHAALPESARTSKEEPEAPRAARHVDPLAQAARRRRLALELAVVLLVCWMPSLGGVLYYALDPPPPLTLGWVLIGIVDCLGIVALLGYLAWLDGPWRRFFGLARPSLADALWGAGVLIAMFACDLVARRFAIPLHFASSEAVTPRLEEGLAWIAPLDFFFWALREEVLYRVYLWKRCAELSGRPALSIVVVSVLFTLTHGYPPEQSLAVFLSGLSLGWIFWARQSLWALVIGHWAFNLFVAG